MEGLAVTPDGSTLVGIVQSPLVNDISSSDTNKTALLRIVTYTIATGEAHQYVYLLEDPATLGTVVSEITALSSTEFLVAERDSLFPGNPTSAAQVKKVWRISLAGATDIGVAAVAGDTLDPAKGLLIGGTTTLEKFVQNQPTAAAQATLAGHGIVPVSKTIELNLLALLTELDPQLRYFPHDKIEGLAVVANGQKLVISDDSDFGIVGLTNTAPPFSLLAKTLPPTGNVDNGEVLIVDLTRLPAMTATATVTIHVTN
jgi:hypothetical protein